MKTQISRKSHSPGKRYSGVYQQQGRMLTDADWNELMDIVKRRIHESLTDVIGEKGAPRDRGILDLSDPANASLRWGNVYIDGIIGEVSPDTSLGASGEGPFELGKQADLPLAGNTIADGPWCLYADIWDRPVISLEDRNLRDIALHGADTCTRTQTMAQVKWCAVGRDPEDEAQNPSRGNAMLSVEFRGGTHQGAELCAKSDGLQLRAGNYLFRVEVHHVEYDNSGKPKKITLKWSAENGAEQHAVNDLPDYFKGGSWIYEFYSDVSEKHPGYHFDNNFTPLRWGLKDDTELPGAINGKLPAYVRRWNGYCTLKRTESNTWEQGTLEAGKDAGTPLALTGQLSNYGDVSIYQDAGTTCFKVNLDVLDLSLELTDENGNARDFLAGDYWIAVVREDAHVDTEELIDERIEVLNGGAPVGIEHHYMRLCDAEIVNDPAQGIVITGVTEYREEDSIGRRLTFPPLSDLTADLVGYDPTLIEALWNHIRETVDLGDPKEPNTVQEAIDTLITNLRADFIAYDPLIKEERWKDILESGDLGDPAEPNTVQEAIDEIVDKMESSDIGYQLPVCTGDSVPSPTVMDLFAETIPGWPDLDGDTRTTTKDILTAFLCYLDSARIPYNPLIKEERWKDILEAGDLGDPVEPNTVQEAIDEIVDKMESSDIGYLLPTCPDAGPNGLTVLDLFSAHVANWASLFDSNSRTTVKDMLTVFLCHLDSAKIPYITSHPSQATIQNVLDGLEDDVNDLDNNKVDRSGDTMTGALTIDIDATSGDPGPPLTLKGNGGQYPVSITQKQVGGSATMELTTTDSSGAQATRILLRGNNDNADIEFYRGARDSEERSLTVNGNTGRVGIGTDTPDEALDVAGTVQSAGLRMTTTPVVGSVLTCSDASGTAVWSAALGVGWVLDGADLSLDKSKVTGLLKITNKTVVNKPIQIDLRNDDGSEMKTGTILYSRTSESGNPSGHPDGFRIRQVDDFFPNDPGDHSDALVFEKTEKGQPSPDGGIAFVNRGNDDVERTALAIKGSGRVGIGTKYPVEALHVVGDIYATGMVHFNKVLAEPDPVSGIITTTSSALSEISGVSASFHLRYPSRVKVGLSLGRVTATRSSVFVSMDAQIQLFVNGVYKTTFFATGSNYTNNAFKVDRYFDSNSGTVIVTIKWKCGNGTLRSEGPRSLKVEIV